MELKIMTQTPGLVAFDPVVLQSFVVANRVTLPNILQAFIDDPNLGNAAISAGCLLPVYSIPAWDYRVRITMADKATVPAEWVLFTTPPFMIKIQSGRLIVSDIWLILNWNADEYLHTSAHSQNVSYTATNEFLVSDEIAIAQGQYEVVIVGFCDTQNTDIEYRHCGYEFLFVRNDQASFNVGNSIETMDLDVVKLP
jgi:hypothetical protein